MDDYVKELLAYLLQILECEAELMDAKNAKQECTYTIAELSVPVALPVAPQAPRRFMNDWEVFLRKRREHRRKKYQDFIDFYDRSERDFMKFKKAKFDKYSAFLTGMNYVEHKRRKRKGIEMTRQEYGVEMNIYSLQMDMAKHEMNSRKEELIQHEQYKQEIEALILQTEKTLSVLYGMDVLHKKYQNKNAAVAFYDYLSTGRTGSLDLQGNDKGAYNMYEEDIRLERAAKFVAGAVVSMGDKITSAIDNLGASIGKQQQLIYDALDNSYKVQFSLTKELSGIRDVQERSVFLQQEIAKQQRLQTEAMTEGPRKMLKNRTGNVVYTGS